MLRNLLIAAAMVLMVAMSVESAPIRLEKDVRMDQIDTGSANDMVVTFKIFNTDDPGTPPVAEQHFQPTEWWAYYEIKKFKSDPTEARNLPATDISRGGYEIATFVADFTNTGQLNQAEEYWMEIWLDGVKKGDREKIKTYLWSLFSQTDTIPSGTIVMWHGNLAAIPSGWSLCDGTNGTPDLRDRFIVGAGGGYAIGDAGGEATHTLSISEMPTHSHQGRFADLHEDSSNDDTSYFVNKGATTDSGYTGGNQPHENRPPYIALAYLMKL